MSRDLFRAKLVLAFAAVYTIWGSTYLAIRYAIETLPPLPMGSVRFLLAGGLMLCAARYRGAAWPSLADWRVAGVIGFLYFLMGHGGVVVAEQWVPSGLTALLIATTPLWVALFDAIRPGGRAPGPGAILGLLIGFGGVLLLIGDGGAADTVDWAGALLLLSAAVAWAAGSVYARYTRLPDSTMMASAMQMLAGGAWLAIAGVLAGQWVGVDVRKFSWPSILAFGYLLVFGSLVAFSAYAWLVKAAQPSALATYAYVNPVVAVGLGWIVADEVVTLRTVAAMAVIVLAVLLITALKARPPAPVARPEAITPSRGCNNAG